jgi:hypothetical protein
LQRKARRNSREDAKGELVEYGTVKAMNSVQPSARKMLQVLHALHGAILPAFFLWLYFTMKAMKSMKGRGRE